MPTYTSVLPLSATNWSPYNGNGAPAPTFSAGTMSVLYPAGSTGAYSGANYAGAPYDASAVGAVIADYDLTYPNQTDQIGIKVFATLDASTRIEVRVKGSSDGASPVTVLEYSGTYTNIYGSRPTRVRFHKTTAGMIYDVLMDGTWHAGPEIATAAACTACTTSVEYNGLYLNGGPSPATITFTVHQDAPPTPTITGLAVSLAATTVTGGQAVQATATATLSDNTTRAATSSEVNWTQTGGGSVNASGLSTAPATITGQAQTVTVTATRSSDSTMHAAATYTVPAGAPPAGVPTIRVRDGVTVLTSGATIDLGMQAGAGVKRRWFVVDNGNSTSTDEALTGLAASLASVAPWLTVGLDYTTAAAVLSVVATSPATVPGTPYVATDVHITSSVSGVQPFTLTVAGTVLAADSGAALLNELAARASRLDAMMTATLAAISTMSELDTQTRAALGSVPVAVQGGSADAIATKTQAAVGTQLTAIGTAATGAQTAATSAATAASGAQSAVAGLPGAVVSKQNDTEAFHALGTDGQPIAVAQTLRLQRTMPDGSPGHQFIYADANGATLGQSAVIAGA